MTEKDLTDRKFYRAGEESRFADESPDRTPQTEHPAYKLAFRDHDFLLRDELRDLHEPGPQFEARYRDRPYYGDVARTDAELAPLLQRVLDGPDRDAVVIVTEWPEFLDLDWAELADCMRGNVVIDARNALDPEVVMAAGLVYEGVGRYAHR